MLPKYFVSRTRSSNSQGGDTMELLLVAGIWVLNLIISIWNSIATGNVWVEANHAGGGRKFMAWIGYLMAGLGFSWNILIVITFVLLANEKLTLTEAEGLLSLGYIVMVPGFLFAGYAIMFNSWANAYRKRTVANFGVAGYNTFANAYNTYHAVKDMPDAFRAVAKVFSGGKSGRSAFLLLLLLASVLAGFIIAGVIVWRVAANDEPLPTQR